MEFASIGQLEREKFSNFTQINVGDATMLTTLQALAQNRSAIVIDQSTDVATNILDELSSGQPLFGFLNDKKYHYQYASISEHVLKDDAATARMNRAYREAWENSQPKLDNLTVINSTIESAVEELRKPKPVADLITYYYPSPVYSPIFKTLELASLLLKPGGEFVVATENEDVMWNFVNYGGDFVTASGYNKRKGNEPYLSAYDVAWGEKGHFEVRIKNRENKLHNHIAGIKKGFAFRAMSALGMVK
jgi:hypothetical protein